MKLNVEVDGEELDETKNLYKTCRNKILKYRNVNVCMFSHIVIK